MLYTQFALSLHFKSENDLKMITIDQLKDVKERTEALERYLDIEGKKVQVEEEQLRTQAPGFWDDAKKAEAQMKKVKELQKWIDGYKAVKTLSDELELSFDFYKEEMVTEEEVDAKIREIGEQISKGDPGQGPFVFVYAIAGFLAVVIPAAGFIVENRGLHGCLRNGSAFPVFPDNDLCVLLVMVPDPGHVHPLRGTLSLHPDTAVAGPLAQQLFKGFVVFPVSGAGVGHGMDEIPKVKADSLFAGQVVAFEIPHRTDKQKFAASGFVVGLLFIGQAGGNFQGAVQFSFNKHIQPLGQLVHDQAHVFMRHHRLQLLRFHIALHQCVPFFRLAVMEGAGIAFHLAPAVVQRFQYVHALRGAGDFPHRFGILIRLCPQHVLAFLIAVDHRYRALQHLPHGIFVRNIHLRGPETVLMAAGRTL